MVVVKQKDFILGYIFGQVENTILQHFINKDKEIHTSVCVPKAWFGLRPVQSVTETLSFVTKEQYKRDLQDILNKYNTSERWYKYDLTIRPQHQYIEFVFHGYYQEQVKEMTVEQIEKELGYRVKIVADKVTYDVYCPNRVCGCCTICGNRKCDHPVPNCKGFAYNPLFKS